MGVTDLYAANAAGMWSGLGPPLSAPDGVLGVRAVGAARYLVRRPLPAGRVEALVADRDTTCRTIVEDPFAVPGVRVPGEVTVLRMPVMVRPAAVVGAAAPDGVRVTPVDDVADLHAAERVVVDGFPHRALQPWRPGEALPPVVLTRPGWRVWLARRDGVPAAAGCTYDDGRIVGVYGLATLPDHRRRGLAWAVMTAMLAAHPGRPATLVATADGLPLYERLGFEAVATVVCYVRRPGLPAPVARWASGLTGWTGPAGSPRPVTMDGSPRPAGTGGAPRP